MLDKIFSPNQAAEYIGKPVRFLEKLRATGNGPKFVKLGHRSIGYRVSELDKWIESRSFTSTAEMSSSKGIGL